MGQRRLTHDPQPMTHHHVLTIPSLAVKHLRKHHNAEDNVMSLTATFIRLLEIAVYML